MDNYEFIGIVFEKVMVDNRFFLNPITVTKLNVNEDETCSTEDFGVLESVFINPELDNKYFIGFLASIPALEALGGSFEEGLQIYLDNILPFNYVQEIENNVIKTYKIDIDRNLVEIASYDGNELYFSNDFDEEEFDVKSIYNKLTKNIIGQDETIKHIVATISRNLNAENYRNKTDMLVIGPNNSGKTEIFRTIKENSNLPIAFVNGDRYLRTAFDQDDVFDIIYNLVTAADGNVLKAEKGLVVIDNIDILFDDYLDKGSKDMVLNALLSFIDGNETMVTFNTEPNQTIKFDSSFVTFAFVGSFEKLLKRKNLAGFKEITDKHYEELNKEDLISYGFPREILNKTSIYKMNELTKEDLFNILIGSENSMLLEYYKFANRNGVKLNINYEAIYKIAELAHEKNIGASGIKTVLEELLGNAIFEVEMNKGIYSSIKLTDETMEKEPPYILYKRKTKTK